ncbi:MAG: peptidylprolyl isomerase [Bacteroidota bacterium]
MRLLFFLSMACCCYACGPKKEPIVCFHTSMGDIRLTLFNSTPAHRDQFVRFCKQLGADSLDCIQILRDNFIEFGVNNGASDFPGATNPEIEAPLRAGALVACSPARTTKPGASFFIVQGRPQTDATLDALVQKEKMQFSPKIRAVYKIYGGIPQLHGRYTVFGQVISGMEVVDRIAALPRDAADKPLKKVSLRLEITK